jgi:hypothetical protein
VGGFAALWVEGRLRSQRHSSLAAFFASVADDLLDDARHLAHECAGTS